MFSAAIGRPSGTRVVRRQLQHARTSQLLAPVLQQLFESLAFEFTALPDRIVGILHWQFPQIRFRTAAVRVVQSSQFTPQDPQRPSVAGNVVHRQQQHMFVVGQMQQGRSQHPVGTQVKWLLRLQTTASLDLCGLCFCRQRTEILDRQLESPARLNHLHRGIVEHGKRRAQRFVPLHNLFQCAPQRLHIQRATQLPTGRHVVGRQFAFHLLQEPKPLLGERQYQWSIHRSGDRSKSGILCTLNGVICFMVIAKLIG